MSHMSDLCANRTTKASGYENITHKYVVSKFACPSCCVVFSDARSDYVVYINHYKENSRGFNNQEVSEGKKVLVEKNVLGDYILKF